MIHNWHTLDFARPDDLPFDIWIELDGDEAQIYVTCVGNHNKDLERKLGYVEGTVVTLPLTEDVIALLRNFVEKATPYGVAVLYQRVPLKPQAPDVYQINRTTKCKGDLERHYLCDHYDDGYCMAKKNFACESKANVLSTYIHKKTKENKEK